MEDLIQDLFRLKIEVVARNQVIPDPMVNSVDTVAVTGLSVAVGIYDGGDAVFLRDFLVGPSIHDILLTDFLLVKSGGDSVFVNPILIHEFSNPVIG